MPMEMSRNYFYKDEYGDLSKESFHEDFRNLSMNQQRNQQFSQANNQMNQMHQQRFIPQPSLNVRINPINNFQQNSSNNFNHHLNQNFSNQQQYSPRFTPGLPQQPFHQLKIGSFKTLPQHLSEKTSPTYIHATSLEKMHHMDMKDNIKKPVQDPSAAGSINSEEISGDNSEDDDDENSGEQKEGFPKKPRDRTNHRTRRKHLRAKRRLMNAIAAQPHTAVYVVQFKREYRGMVVENASEHPTDYKIGDVVCTHTHHGDDIGTVTEIMPLNQFKLKVEAARAKANTGLPEEDFYLGTIQRTANEQDLKQLAEQRLVELDVMKHVRIMTYKSHLPMTVVEAEFQFDRAKLTVYYTSEERVDFRDIIKDLTAIYNTRVWIQSIGHTVVATIPVRYAVVDSDDEGDGEDGSEV